MKETDEAIYDRFLAERDENNLRILLERHNEKLLLFLYGYVGNYADAEELALDVFAEVAAGRTIFAGRSSFKTWLFSIGKKMALQHLRRRKPQLEQMELPNTESERGHLQMEQPSAEPEMGILQMERNRELYNALEQLSPDYRQTLLLLYFEQMSCEEAARVMGKSRRQVYHLAERGRAALRNVLEKMGLGYEDFV